MKSSGSIKVQNSMDSDDFFQGMTNREIIKEKNRKKKKFYS